MQSSIGHAQRFLQPVQKLAPIATATYGVVCHPVESAKGAKDAVIAHPYVTASIAGSAVAEEEIRRGFPMSARVKKAAETYAPKAGKYVKEKGSLALGYTKENGQRVWEFTKAIPSILWAHKVKSSVIAGVIAGTAAVVSIIRYRSAITERSKTVWGKTVSAWNWLKSKVRKSNETSAQEDSQQSE